MSAEYSRELARQIAEHRNSGKLSHGRLIDLEIVTEMAKRGIGELYFRPEGETELRKIDPEAFALEMTGGEA